MEREKKAYKLAWGETKKDMFEITLIAKTPWMCNEADSLKKRTLNWKNKQNSPYELASVQRSLTK